MILQSRLRELFGRKPVAPVHEFLVALLSGGIPGDSAARDATIEIMFRDHLADQGSQAARRVVGFHRDREGETGQDVPQIVDRRRTHGRDHHDRALQTP